MGRIAVVVDPSTDESEIVAALSIALPEETVFPATAGPAPDPASVDIAVVTAPAHGALSGYPNLAFIQSLWAGVDKLMTDPNLPKSAAIARLVDPDMAISMAESVTAHVLALHKDHPHYTRNQARRGWEVRPAPKAADRTVGFLGLGTLAQASIACLRPLGFPIVGWSRGPKSLDGVTVHSGAEGFKTVLGAADILVNLLPLTPETEGILDAEAFAAMRPGSALINVARGRHIVEADLILALDAGRPAEAVLDAFPKEPVPDDHPFWTHPAIRLFPHVAARTNKETAVKIAAAAVRDFRAGKPVAHLVDAGKGY